jgi:NDP-sugar pyrophosphorylase family protein
MSDLNILVLASGRGQRFVDAGFSFPKPIIECPLPHMPGKTGPMLEMVVGNLNLKGNYIFTILKEHYEKYSLKYLLSIITRPNSCEIIVVDSVTEGAACSALLAKNLINNDTPLIMVNSDQYIDFDSSHMLKFIKENNGDGCIQTFYGLHCKWSFSKVEEETGLITEVAEKKPISTCANTGLYYWKHGKCFVESAEEMIAKNDRTLNEFYVAPTYNYLIKQNKRILNYPVASMFGTGVPEDLARFTRIMEERNK